MHSRANCARPRGGSDAPAEADGEKERSVDGGGDPEDGEGGGLVGDGLPACTPAEGCMGCRWVAVGV